MVRRREPRIDTPLCRLDELTDGDSRGFDPLRRGRDTLFIVRRGNDVYAWADACPHIDGAPMAWRKNAYLNSNRDRIVCFAHGALFDIATGVCTLGPCLGKALTAIPVRVAEDGMIHVDAGSPSSSTSN